MKMFALLVQEEVPYEANWETCVGIFESEDAAMMARAWMINTGRFQNWEIEQDGLWSVVPININNEVTDICGNIYILRKEEV